MVTYLLAGHTICIVVVQKNRNADSASIKEVGMKSGGQIYLSAAATRRGQKTFVLVAY
jgi:hypothetical protein